MQEVNSFIKLLGKNYYSDFIIDINTEIIDFDKYAVLVKYQNTFYFELSNVEIINKWKETITRIKENYQEALTEIYTVLLSHDSSKVNTYLDLNTDAIKLHLKTIKKDFYIDDVQSRYYSIIEDNPELVDLGNKYHTSLEKNEGILDEDIYKLFNNTKHENIESIYHLRYLYERNKTLSFIPFSLFSIAEQFISNLNKIRLRINEDSKEVNTVSQSKEKDVVIIEETYFESFLKLLDDNLILKRSTAIGVMVYFKNYIKEIKSETLAALQTKGENRDDYLDYLINEIEKQGYLKNINISHIQKWLEEYKISIEEIFEMKYGDNAIEAVIDRHYMDMDKRSEEKHKAEFVQSNFRDYFCSHYADELITFLKSLKKENVQIKEVPIKITESQMFKNAYFEDLVKYLSTNNYLYESCFLITYTYELLPTVEKVIIEIEENLLVLPENKIDNYLNLLIRKIEYFPIVTKDEKLIEKWIKKYNLELKDFPFIENKEINKMITIHPVENHFDGKELFDLEDLQIDFHSYSCMIEAKKVIAFLESKRINSNKKSNMIENNDAIENGKQLTVNQAIILLDKLGVFTTDILESSPNTKKAILISQLLGKNVKNIKTSLESLDKKTSELGVGYQRDLNKIQQLLDNL